MPVIKPFCCVAFIVTVLLLPKIIFLKSEVLMGGCICTTLITSLLTIEPIGCITIVSLIGSTLGYIFFSTIFSTTVDLQLISVFAESISGDTLRITVSFARFSAFLQAEFSVISGPKTKSPLV